MAEHVLVLVTAVEAGGPLRDADGEALGAARALAQARRCDVACALIGADQASAAAEAAERGADLILTADSPGLARFDGGRCVTMAAEAVRLAEARVALIPRGPDLLELAPRLAARLDGASVIGATEVRSEGDDVSAIAAVFGGAARAAYAFRAPGPRVIGLAPAVAEIPERRAGRSAPTIALAIPDADGRVTTLEAAPDVAGPRLEDATVVVAGGRGLQDGENYGLIRELADGLGGMPGASRAIVDDGWASFEQQVGLTGKVVTPDIYFAVGISGASQHMAGCSNARCIVAINTDADAPIFTFADYGIVDDALDVLPALVRLARERGA